MVREIRHGRIKKLEEIEIESAFTKNPVHIKPFFNWLGWTKSAYTWFKMHRLSDVLHLMTEDESEIKNIVLPSEIQSLVFQARKPSKDFMLFEKGIDNVL